MFQSLRIASRSVAMTLLAALLSCLPLSMAAAATPSRGDIVVVTVHGTVDATMAGMTVPLSAGAILQLPATVRTAADGAVELRQGTSTFAAAGNTELEIPQSAAQDGLIERIIQIRGNAFYNIGKRTGTRLRVEAPYLVAVIKGTQFNVAAQEDSTTIALFEGRLEVRASDDSDVVDLEAGEIAIRRRDDVSISVLRLNAARGDNRRNQELAARPQADSPGSDSGSAIARNDGNSNSAGTRVDATTTDSLAPGNVLGVTPTERGRIVDTIDTGSNGIAKTEVAADVASIDTRIDTEVAATVDAGPVNADVGTRVSADVPAGAVDVGIGASAAVGEVVNVDAGVSAAVDLSAGTVAAGTDVGVDAGPVSADVGASATVDVSAGTVDVDVGTTAAVADVATVDTSVGAGVDLPAGTVDVAADTTVAVADVPVDVGAGAAVDAGAGTVDVGLDTSVAGADVVVADVGVDTSTGVSADVGVGPVEVGLDVGAGGVDVDLGLGASDDSGGGGGLLGGLGGLLGGRKRN
jgi:hypothetical protein